MTTLKTGDKVTVSNKTLQTVYGIKPDSVYEVEKVNGYFVTLKQPEPFAGAVKMEHLTSYQNQTPSQPQVSQVSSPQVSPRRTQCQYVSQETLDEWVEDVVDELLFGKMAFTAYDVTRRVREDNPGFNLPHYKVREIVRNLMSDSLETGDYKEATVNVGTDVYAQLFYHEDFDPTTYKVGDGAQVLQQTKVNVTFNTNSTIDGGVYLGINTAPDKQKPGLVRRFLNHFGL